MNLHPPRPARQRTTLHASSLTYAVMLATLCMASLAPVANSAQAQTYQEVREQRRDAQRVQAPDFGQREFNANCAACHGMDAKGRGPVAGFLTKNPPDLTTVAKRNGGVFPMDRLYRVVDGTELPEGAQAGGPHGSREMPIWGRDYRVRDAEYFGDTPYNPDGMVRGRILALLEYLNRLQVK